MSQIQLADFACLIHFYIIVLSLVMELASMTYLRNYISLEVDTVHVV